MAPELEVAVQTAVLAAIACLVAESVGMRGLCVIPLLLLEWGPSGGLASIIICLTFGLLGRLLKFPEKS